MRLTHAQNTHTTKRGSSQAVCLCHRQNWRIHPPSPPRLKNTDSRTQCFVTLFHYLSGPFSLRQQQELTQIHWTNTAFHTDHSDIAEAAGSVFCEMVSVAQLATQTDHNYAGGMKECCCCKSLLLAFYTYEQKALKWYCECFFVTTPSSTRDCFLHRLTYVKIHSSTHEQVSPHMNREEEPSDLNWALAFNRKWTAKWHVIYGL